MSEESINTFVPNFLKFKATHNGVEIKDGDFWTPLGMSSDRHCYPVIISSAGIHWTKKIQLEDSGTLTGNNGKRYYADWEDTKVHSAGVKLELITRNVSMVNTKK